MFLLSGSMKAKLESKVLMRKLENPLRTKVTSIKSDWWQWWLSVVVAAAAAAVAVVVCILHRQVQKREGHLVSCFIPSKQGLALNQELGLVSASTSNLVFASTQH